MNNLQANNKFTIGSKIRLKPTAENWSCGFYSQTWEYPNEPLSEGDNTVGSYVKLYPDDFELVDYIPRPDGKHIHYDMIVAWANSPSLAVQWRDNDDCTWQNCSDDKQHPYPIWDEDVQYRFKPSFPTTSLTDNELTTFNDGKYAVVFHDNGKLEALRYGETWRSLTGDNLVYWLAVELQNAREELSKLEFKVGDLEREIMGDNW